MIITMPIQDETQNPKLVDYYTVKNVTYIMHKKPLSASCYCSGIKTFSVSRILPETDGIHYSRLHDLDRNLPLTKKTSGRPTVIISYMETY